MTEAQEAEYLAMCSRVFVRALRDPNQGAGEEYELSEGQAAALLRKRERAAIAAFLGAVSDGDMWAFSKANVLSEIDYGNPRKEDVALNASCAALAALRRMAEEE